MRTRVTFSSPMLFRLAEAVPSGTMTGAREPWRVQPLRGVSCKCLIVISVSAETCIEWAVSAAMQ